MNAYVFAEWDPRKIQHETHTHLWTNSSLNQAHNHEIILKKNRDKVYCCDTQPFRVLYRPTNELDQAVPGFKEYFNF